MLCLCKKICGNPSRVRALVRDDENFGRTCKHVDTHSAVNQFFGLCNEFVARTDNYITARNWFSSKSHCTDCLWAATSKCLCDSANVCRCHDVFICIRFAANERFTRNASAGLFGSGLVIRVNTWRRAQNNFLNASRNSRSDCHDNAWNERESSSRNISTRTVNSYIFLTGENTRLKLDLKIVERLTLLFCEAKGQVVAVFNLLVKLRIFVLHLFGSSFELGHRNFNRSRGRNIKFCAVLRKSFIPAFFYVRKDIFNNINRTTEIAPIKEFRLDIFIKLYFYHYST